MSSQDQACSQETPKLPNIFLSQGKGGGTLARFRGQIWRSRDTSYSLLPLVSLAFLGTAALTITCYKQPDEVVIIFLWCCVVRFTNSFMPEQSKKVAQQKHRFETVAASSRLSDANSNGSDEERFSSGRKPSSSSDSRSESNAEVLSENHLSSTSNPEY